ncbi:MAG: hypothetical protein H7Y20_09200, partial [Bryobacteraceae bacterium]|nr:hypothetical protein [Bryobacteraceae bacterium]
IFVVSFHHIGRELTGIAEATAFARLQSLQDSENRNSSSDELTLSSAEPFVFTYQTEVDKVASAFDQWLDDALTIALKAFGDRL